MACAGCQEGLALYAVRAVASNKSKGVNALCQHVPRV